MPLNPPGHLLVLHVTLSIRMIAPKLGVSPLFRILWTKTPNGHHVPNASG
ncbi:hypothetical protein S101450_00759 [Komagataeibacter saccharivorans]|nr:hypothetical protein S101450_00759 [Komagataeibacter saccharivorans]